MTLLNDKQITDANIAMSKVNGSGMITPFFAEQVREIDGKKVISYGLSSFGYDIRLGSSIRVPSRSALSTFRSAVLDPKAVTEDSEKKSLWEPQAISPEGFEILPHGYVLASTVERFHIPDDIIAICLGKSTYARCGIVVNVTPLEPGWEGFLTLEISNTTGFRVKIYANEGIAQLLFYRGERPATTYADRNGKYQKQENEPVLPRL